MNSHSHSHDKNRIWALTLGALGIVFGDIGTSPLYALRECFSEHSGLSVSHDNVIGILSLVLWTLLIIVSLKYILFVLRADNKGEGGILSLLALSAPPTKTSGGFKRWLIYIALFGSALLYGDGIITPAISVLSAVEGIKVATPIFDDFIVPITVVILFGLFYFQSQGTARIGVVFGPVILLYFAIMTALGLPAIFSNPEVLHAFNPWFAIDFFIRNGMTGFWTLGSAFLVVTGCEALYADMGHFGRIPIQRAWTFIVWPALTINYLGQGALLLSDPSAIENPFFSLAPEWALYPLVALVTLATVVASQALISGVFSLTRQAILMGFCPRLEIVHTSDEEMGQIYVPQINWALMICTIWLVIQFKSSSNLAAAYGIAVAATMGVTTFLVAFVAYRRWRWKLPLVITVTTVLVAIDFTFLAANIPKIPHGGWFPLVVAGVIFALMTTWKRGRRILAVRLKEQTHNFEDFVLEEVAHPIHRIPGTAIFMSSDPEMTPPALARNVRHNRVLHARVILLSVATKEVPRVDRSKRVIIEAFPDGFYRMTVYFGFMEIPTIAEILESLRLHEIEITSEEITFFLGRETLIASDKLGNMALWRKHLFAFMSRNAQRATQFFHIPANQVIEIGSQIEL